MCLVWGLVCLVRGGGGGVCSRGAVPSPGGCLLLGGGVPGPGGGVCLVQGGGVPGPGGSAPGGVWHPSMH